MRGLAKRMHAPDTRESSPRATVLTAPQSGTGTRHHPVAPAPIHFSSHLQQRLKNPGHKNPSSWLQS